MPGRRYTGSRKRYNPRPIIDSMKNVIADTEAYTTATTTTLLARAVDSPTTAVAVDVQRGCIIKAIWISLDVCGLAATGALQNMEVFLIKNPGQNLTPPNPFTQGTSNEKKFIFKTWHAMTMRNQDDNPPYHWEGWIKIPKRYQRMGTDDRLQLNGGMSTLTGHMSVQCIYKWFR